MPDASVGWDAAHGESGWPGAAVHPVLTPAPAPVAPAPHTTEGQSSDNPYDQHAPVYPTNTAADNAPAVEPGQPTAAPAAAPVQQGGQLDQPRPGAWDTLKGAFEQSAYGSIYEHLQHPDYSGPAVSGYDPYKAGDLSDVPEDKLDLFTKATSPEQVRVIKDRLNAEEQAQDVTSRAGWEGYVMNLGMSIVDPVSLTAMALPGVGELGLGASLAARAARGAAVNVVAGEAMAAEQAALTETHHYTDNMGTRILTNAVAGGVLGPILSRAPKPEVNQVQEAVHAALTGTAEAPVIRPNPESLDAIPTESAAGAAAVRDTSLADESIARGGRFIANTVGRISPSDRILLDSKVPEARRLAQQLVDPGFTLEKNLKDVPTAPSIEMQTNRLETMRNLQIVKQFDNQFLDYKKGGGDLNKGEFSAAVADAMNLGDGHQIPQVAAFAKWARPMLDKDADKLTEMGVPLPAKAEGRSYLPWVWDKYAVLSKQTKLEGILRDHFTANPKEPEITEPAGMNELKYTAGEGGKEHTVTSANGTTTAMRRGNALQIIDTETAPGAQGKGENTARIARMAKEASAQKLGLQSDTKVAPAAAKAYAKLEKQGYEVTRNPFEKDEEGNLVSTSGRPVFEVRKPEPAYREPAEITAAVRDTMDHIMNLVHNNADLGSGVSSVAPMKARALPDLSWEIRKEFMSTDVEHILKSYNHTILPRMAMHDAGFSPNLETEFQNISDKYRLQIAAAGTDDAAKKALSVQHARDIANLTLLRDRVLNQVGPRMNETRAFVRTAQLIRTFNYQRMLGGQTLSAPPDLGRLVVRYGFTPTMQRYAQYLGRMGRGLMIEDAQKVGTAADVVLHTRQSTLEGVGNELSGSDKISRFARNSSNAFTKYTGIATWDSMMRALSSQLEQDSLHAMLTKENPSQWEIGLMNAHGISTKDLPAIKAEWDVHGSNEWGLKRARTELWQNQAAAEKVELAIQRAASSHAFFVGKGDLPGFANSSIGAMFLQFKAFVASSVNRLAIPLSQGIAHGDIHAYNGAVALMALGGLSWYMKELASGHKPDMRPTNIALQAAGRSGILTYAPDVYDPFAAMLHLPRFQKFQDLSPVETMLGPTGGTIDAGMLAVQALTGGKPKMTDANKLRQLIPYNNVFYLNRLVNMGEGKLADWADLRGAPQRPALDYLNPAKDAETRVKQDKTHLFGIEQIPNAF